MKMLMFHPQTESLVQMGYEWMHKESLQLCGTDLKDRVSSDKLYKNYYVYLQHWYLILDLIALGHSKRSALYVLLMVESVGTVSHLHHGVISRYANEFVIYNAGHEEGSG